MIGQKETAHRLISYYDGWWIYIPVRISLTRVEREWDKETRRGRERQIDNEKQREWGGERVGEAWWSSPVCFHPQFNFARNNPARLPEV